MKLVAIGYFSTMKHPDEGTTMKLRCYVLITDFRFSRSM